MHDETVKEKPAYEAVCRSIAAASFPPLTAAILNAGPGTTVEIDRIEYETDYSAEGFGELVCRVRGHDVSLSSAATALTHAAAVNLQVIAVSANAAILPFHLTSTYELRRGGQFVVSRRLGNDPQIARRTMDVDLAVNLMELCNRHPKRDRLLRAIENYGAALRLMDPIAPVHSVIHLWIAVENLTHVCLERLGREHGETSRPDLARALGMQPRSGEDFVREGDLFGFVRRAEIFQEDEAAHNSLKDASDGIEHGFLRFKEAMSAVSEKLEPAARCIRMAILREAGLSHDEVLAAVSGVYEHPLALWRPVLTAHGRFVEEEFDFDQNRVHLRLDGELRVGNFDHLAHTTEVEFDSNLDAVEGPGKFVTRVALDSPGKLNAFKHDFVVQ